VARKCLLFVYGQLQPAHTPPRSLSQAWPDRIHAVLYDLGPFPAAVQVGVAADWIEGFTLEIDADELAALDEFEDTESGEFARILVETEKGHTAWVYEYRFPVPGVLVPVKRWRK
jgi:gamma-glutamylcyclotransferase (GGCT)/AIG2-like uncharacterized protein YtfP